MRVAGEVTPTIIVHGGAGEWPEALREGGLAGCREAALAGARVLQAGGSAVDAVVAAVRALEADPRFNAGTGAVLTRERTIELDASVMDGQDLAFGAVAAMPDIAHPVDVARALMDSREHTLLCGEGAWAFAREHGFAPAAPGSLITERSLERWHELMRARERRAETPDEPGTVGACAVDARGHVAAATSTGGTLGKRIGRIGDTPICGAGTYADDRAGAASATGHGESIMRVCLTARVCLYLRQGMSAWDASWRGLDELCREVQGEAGVICVDTRGNLAAAHNSKAMAMAAYAVTPDGLRPSARIVSDRDDPIRL